MAISAVYVVSFDEDGKAYAYLLNILAPEYCNPSMFDTKDPKERAKLVNIVVPGIIDERAVSTKRVLNPWERNENHTLCLNSAKAIGCTVVNIGTQHLVEGRPHLLLGLISLIIKVILLMELFFIRRMPYFHKLD
ncbi:hypothetical protein OIU84_015417 [Salix udensis]|uniref:Calponin-homology (CH) domain-containing protein n=1 Tax=Salix udensis TaxID=889485 RepID=A0AAD6JG18_9ROSI|nr:hypothetical protein OIU84_015417 [Salix udensis]